MNEKTSGTRGGTLTGREERARVGTVRGRRGNRLGGQGPWRGFSFSFSFGVAAMRGFQPLFRIRG